MSDVNDFCVVDEKPAGETRTVLLVASICVFVLICGVLQIVLIKKFCISKCPVLLGRKLASSSIQNNSKAKCFMFPCFLLHIQEAASRFHILVNITF